MDQNTKIAGLTILASLILLIGGVFFLSGDSKDFNSLDICVQHTGGGMHIHPHLTIFIKGEKQMIPSDIGVTPACMRPIHTHDETGALHLEFPRKRDVKLGEFFQVWGKQFKSGTIFDKVNGPDGNVKMFVNGQENTEFENYMMKDGDNIEIRFE